MAPKIFALLLLFIGEALSVYAEMVGAKSFASHATFWEIFPKMFGLITIAGGCLIAAYMLGFSAFKNIWVVAVCSVTFILIVEPFLGWSFFQQIPTTGAVIGFVLGIAGMFLTIFA